MRLKIFFLVLIVFTLANAKPIYVKNYACDDGFTYTGNLENGKRNGEGTAISPKGNIYTGKWKNGSLPYGTLVSDDGKYRYEYEGNFNSKLQPQGFGAKRYVKGKNAGSTYIGNFANGLRDGIGKQTDVHGKIAFGRWKKDEFVKPEKQKYEAEDRIYGIDLSHHNTKVDWDNLAVFCDNYGRAHGAKLNKQEQKSGEYMLPVSFVYVRATEGATLVDAMYAKHFSSARSHHIPVGSYHTMKFSTSKAEDQLKNFLKASNNCANDDLPPVLALDGKYVGEAKEAGKAKVQKMVDWWLKEVEKKTGRKPIIYTNSHFVNEILDLNKLKGYTLWIARYNTEEPTVHPWYIWQFTETGRIKGINSVDIDFFDGNYKQFKKRMLKDDGKK